MLKQKHFFNGAVHIHLGEDINGNFGKTVINVNRIIEGPHEDSTFIDIIHIVDDYYETMRVGSIIMPETLTEDINRLVDSFEIFYNDVKEYYNEDALKDLIRMMVLDQKWHESNDPIYRLLMNILNKDGYKNDDEFVKVIYYGPRYDDDGDHIYNASHEYLVYKDHIDYIQEEEYLEPVYDDDEDDDYNDDEIIEEVVVEEKEEPEHHHEYSQIFSRHFNEKNIDFSLFPFGYVSQEDDIYVKLYASLPQDQDQALQMVKNTVANIELKFKPVADQWNSNPKLQELYDEIKKYNLEEVEGDNTWFHDKGSTIVNSEELKELMKKVLNVIGLEQDPNTKYWEPIEKEN